MSELFNLWAFFKDILNTQDNSLVGLRHLNEVKMEEPAPKQKEVKKEYKLSELMKKTMVE